MSNNKTTKIFILLGMLFVSSCGKKVASTANAINGLSSKAIIGTTDWINITQATQNANVSLNAKAVGIITIPSKESRCTAFLVGESLVMTNWHCFPQSQDAIGATFYPRFLQGKSSFSFEQTLGYDCSHLLLSDEDHDVALLQCAGFPGKIEGTVTLNQNSLNMNLSQKVYVIQQNCDYYTQPDCAPVKKVAVGITVSHQKVASLIDQEELSADFYYTADTLGGSSGSPVFSATSHQVIALHHQGHGQTPWSAGRGSLNSGVPMSQIVTFLRQEYPQLAAMVKSIQ